MMATQDGSRGQFPDDEVESAAALLERMEVALSQLQRQLLGEIKRRRREHLTIVPSLDEEDENDG